MVCLMELLDLTCSVYIAFSNDKPAEMENNGVITEGQGKGLGGARHKCPEAATGPSFVVMGWSCVLTAVVGARIYKQMKLCRTARVHTHR